MNRRQFLTAGVVFGAARAGRSASPTVTAQQQPALALETDQPLLLSWNENALGLAPAARAALLESTTRAHRYPDAARERLLEALAKRHGLEVGNVILGNGSTEILQMAVQAASGPNALLLMADPTFEAVVRYQRPLPYRLERIPLNANYGHDLDRMRALATDRQQPTLVYLCNPNNPTATLTPSAEIDAWIGEAPETVTFLIDEAYHEYVQAPGYWSAVKWVTDRPNVIVARTFSKIYAMAGLRLGYALGHSETIERLNAFRATDNANIGALAAAEASLEDDQLVARSRASNAAAKAIVHQCLDELGLGYLSSHANFLMHRVTGDLETYCARMLDHGIRVGRPFPPLLGYNRLSLGLPAQMEHFTETLRRFRSKGWI